MTTPAREMGKSLADSMLRRLEEGLARRETRLCPAAGDAKMRETARAGRLLYR
ncbi:hypothetical protein LOF13_00585 [Klebsiella pneumoniae subsp. pneumoniae]|nr:hypothetical protein LOF13_00585 [Klebsiella pneumoniae subsp. pneumoniae]